MSSAFTPSRRAVPPTEDDDCCFVDAVRGNLLHAQIDNPSASRRRPVSFDFVRRGLPLERNEKTIRQKQWRRPRRQLGEGCDRSRRHNISLADHLRHILGATPSYPALFPEAELGDNLFEESRPPVQCLYEIHRQVRARERHGDARKTSAAADVDDARISRNHFDGDRAVE